MSDPLRTDPSAAPDASGDADRHLRIEQLLLSGLDHYFAGQYEQAINVWTRVVFLERGHDRARAYIERARSALAEQHRESEELLHRGVAAYNAGNTGEARELLTRAVEQGGPSDTALVFLERLSRLDAPPARLESVSATVVRSLHPPPSTVAAGSGHGRWLVAACVSCILLAAALFSDVPAAWLNDLPDGNPVRGAQAPLEPLPVVRASEPALDRARVFYANGHLKDALRMLDRIDVADPLRPEADQLRGEVQRELLVAGSAHTSPTTDAGHRP